MTSDCHNKDNGMENAIHKIKNTSYSEAEIELLLEFKDFCFAEGVGKHRVTRYLQTFSRLESTIEFRLGEADKQDMIRLVGKINQGDIAGSSKEEYSPWTKSEWRKALKKFYKWYTEEESPDIVSFFSTAPKKEEVGFTDPDELPGRDDMRVIKEQMDKSRSKAFIWMLWESGTRISELLGLKWKDIRHKDTHAVLKVDGKTGERRIPVKECLDDLKAWKEEHPDSSPQSYVFTHLSENERMSYNGMKKYLDRAAESSEVDCKKNPHAFRKSRATFLAKKNFNVFQLMQFFGWSDPATAKTYVRLANSDLEDSFKQLHGIESNEAGSSQKPKIEA